MQTSSARSIGEILEFVRNLQEQWKDEQGVELWFRGSKCLSNSLTPKLYRTSPHNYLSLAEGERGLISEFISFARPFGTFSDGAADWYFLAQHHGYPTRLLDWTSSLCTALYFATNELTVDTCGTYQPCIWIMEPGSLNMTFHKLTSHVASVEYLFRHLTEFEFPVMSENAKDRISSISPEWPLAMVPMQSNPRLFAQQGKFTIHGTDRRPLEKLYIDNKFKLTRVDIDPSQINEVRDQLFLLGVSKLTVFPEVASIPDEIFDRRFPATFAKNS